MKQRVHKDHYEKQGLSLAKKSACVELEVGSPEYSVVHAIQDTRERDFKLHRPNLLDALGLIRVIFPNSNAEREIRL